MSKKNKPKEPNSIGGQAVIEGVMMRGKNIYSLAVRNTKNEVVVEQKPISSRKSVNKIKKLPLIRGTYSFVDSLILGVKTISRSAEIAGLDDTSGEPSKFDKFLEKKFGDKLNDYLIYISVGLSIVLVVSLFMLLPVWISSFIRNYVDSWMLGIAEGLTRIIIFLVYIVLISNLKDIKRVFEYHGAEHKTINCFEHGAELTVDNVKKFSRFHKRCGTSFLLIVMVISMLVFLFVRTDDIVLRFLSRIFFVPLIAGLSYEVIKWAGRRESALVDIISYPGMLLQRLTTKEPDPQQIEVAIASMKCVLEAEAGE